MDRMDPAVAGGIENGQAHAGAPVIDTTYTIQPAEPLLAEVRRLGREQIGAALISLDRAATDPLESIHDARKRLKKTRALLRLVRDGMPARYQEDNRTYRDAGRLLSPVRQAQVAGRTLELLRSAPESPAALSDALHELAPLLHHHRQSVVDRALAPGGSVSRARILVQEAFERLEGWQFKRPARTLTAGLARTYERGRTCRKAAYRSRTPTAFHQLRKRLKYRWYHARLLSDVWPAEMGAVAETLGVVGDRLGEANDLADLLRWLDQASWPYSAADRSLLVRAVWSQIDQDWNASQPDLDRLYLEGASAYAERIVGYWKLARAGD